MLCPNDNNTGKTCTEVPPAGIVWRYPIGLFVYLMKTEKKLAQGDVWILLGGSLVIVNHRGVVTRGPRSLSCHGAPQSCQRPCLLILVSDNIDFSLG